MSPNRRFLSLQQPQEGYSKLHEPQLSPYIKNNHYSTRTAEENDDGWRLSECTELLRTSWVGRAVETMQIKWWQKRTGFTVDEGMISENDYRRDERLVAASEVSLALSGACSVTHLQL